MATSEAAIVVLACAVIATQATVFDLLPLSDKFIDTINSKQTTWRAGRNFPHNTPLDYMKKLLGFIPNNEEPILSIIKHNAELKATLPESFDARKNWPNCPSIGEIRDQGACSSCWAFAAVETMTDRVCIFSNGTKNFHFSAEDVVTCSRERSIKKCSGGNPLNALNYWTKYGIVSGGNYNTSQGCMVYTTAPCVHHAPDQEVNATGDILPCLKSNIDTPKCRNSCDVGYEKTYEEDKMFGKKAYRVYGEEKVMREILKHGPVVAGLAVYRDFYTYKSGVYQHVEVYDEERLGWHAVKIIGWGVENDTPYWLIANSWNSYWGDKGFFKILRGENECYIESFVMTGEPLLSDK